MPLRISALFLLSLSLTLSPNSFAAERVLYSFPSGVNQGAPRAALVFDSAGNLYGTSTLGGKFKEGSIYILVPTITGRWRQRTIYSFMGLSDGAFPYDALTPDGLGNFYGTAQSGGTGFGTVFELSPLSQGRWLERVIYTFTGGLDGGNPVGGVVFDSTGNLYGTTTAGGVGNNGTAFELLPDGTGRWTETTLHDFLDVPDGAQPQSSLVLDGAGNLFGTTLFGGSVGGGTVFELSPSSSGWTESIIFDFIGSAHGSGPGGPLILDSLGNLYGMTRSGGIGQGGTVFELSPGSSGWIQTLLHQFTTSLGGNTPIGGVIFDSSGNLYGTTDGGGTAGFGTAYKLIPSSGIWKIQYLHNFGGGTDGSIPLAGVVLDSAGDVFGTTSQGGAGNTGTVYEIVP